MNEETRNFSLSSFKKASSAMVAKNEATYKGYSSWGGPRLYNERVRDYSLEEIEKIIESGSLVEQQRLSRNYFYMDGFYKQIIIYYATLLKYCGLLIPNLGLGQNLSNSSNKKRYFRAVNFIDSLQLETLCTNIAQKALVNGSYYGIIYKIDEKNYTIIDLPTSYACSNFKDLAGNDIIEFDVSYFNTIIDKDARRSALSAYPKFISRAYDKYSKGKLVNSWIKIPTEMGVCFPFFDGRPLFLNIIPATIKYEQAVDTEIERDLEEIRKILVQKIPHLQDGRLLFEPEEAEEMHAAAVGMLKGNKNLSVLTTYSDVEAIVSKTTADGASSSLERLQQNIYTQAGVSSQVFSSTGSATLETSVKNDTALMMYLANKIAKFVTFLTNKQFANKNIQFKYMFLPVTYYNEEKYVSNAFKLASSGYSFLVPAVAMGINQKDLGNLKDLENDVLELDKKLLPLSSAYTQSGDSTSGDDTPKKDIGRPKKDQEDKEATTIQKEDSLDNQTGGN